MLSHTCRRKNDEHLEVELPGIWAFGPRNRQSADRFLRSSQDMFLADLGLRVPPASFGARMLRRPQATNGGSGKTASVSGTQRNQFPRETRERFALRLKCVELETFRTARAPWITEHSQACQYWYLGRGGFGCFWVIQDPDLGKNREATARIAELHPSHSPFTDNTSSPGFNAPAVATTLAALLLARETAHRICGSQLGRRTQTGRSLDFPFHALELGSNKTAAFWIGKRSGWYQLSEVPPLNKQGGLQLFSFWF